MPANLEHGGKENYAESTDRPVPGKNLVRSAMRLEISRDAHDVKKRNYNSGNTVARFGTQ